MTNTFSAFFHIKVAIIIILNYNGYFILNFIIFIFFIIGEEKITGIKEKTFAEHIEDKDTAVIQGIRRCVKKHRTNRDLYKK